MNQILIILLITSLISIPIISYSHIISVEWLDANKTNDRSPDQKLDPKSYNHEISGNIQTTHLNDFEKTLKKQELVDLKKSIEADKAEKLMMKLYPQRPDTINGNQK